MIEKIREEMNGALKKGDKIRLETLRMILSELKKEEIDSRKPLDKDASIKVLKRSLKMRKDSIEQFKAGNRPDLVEREEAQLKVLEEFCPKSLSREETEQIVLQAIAAIGAKGKQDTGKVMKEVMGKFGAQVDGKTVQEIVASKLT